MSANIEGTGYDGEEQNAQFLQWMLSKEGGAAKKPLTDKLIQSGINSIDMLESIGEDLDGVADEIKLTYLQKIKLRNIIQHKLPNKHSIIDKEETEALTKMQNKLKSMESAIDLIAKTKQSIDEQVTTHTATIQSTFKQFHSLLNGRETSLISKLNKIANDKKNKLQHTSKKLEQQTVESHKQHKLCHKRLKKAVELHEIEARKKDILQIAKEFDRIKVITKNDSVITDNKINLAFQSKLMISTINSFATVSAVAIIPELLSLTDNTDSTITLKWKLNGRNVDEKHNDTKLMVEWSETKSNNINEHDEKWQYNKEYNLNDSKAITVEIVGKTSAAIYLFRIQYFDGHNWSQQSNIKSITVADADESWDPNCKSNDFHIDVNSISNTTASQRSAYLTKVVSKGINEWTFRIDKINSGGWSFVGVWKTKFEPVTDSHLIRVKGNKCYPLAVDRGKKVDPKTKKETDYANACKQNDILVMTLNFNNLSLSYKINGTDYGKAFDIEKTTYKGAITMDGKGAKFTLLSYKRC